MSWNSADAAGRLMGTEFTAGAVMGAAGEAATVSVRNVGFLAAEALGEDSEPAERIHGETLARIPQTARQSEGVVAP